MSAATRISQQVFTCPACDQDVHASVTVEFTLDQAVANGGRKDVTATGRVTGLRVSHDCTPAVAR